MESDREFIVALLSAANRMERRLDSNLSNIKGVSFTEYQILAAIEDAPGESATRVDLAYRVGLTPSGVTRALRPLEKLGFVETVRDGRDARRSQASLTAQGRELIGDARGVVDDSLEEMTALHSLTGSKRAQLLEILGKIAAA